MNQAQAQALADVVRARTSQTVSVEPDGEAFVVTVRGASGNVWTLYADQDWDWLGERILATE